MTVAASPSTGNSFLDALPSATSRYFRPLLVRIALELGEPVYECDETIDRVLFPIASLVSFVHVMVDGGTAEVGIVGREGMTGLPLTLGQTTSDQRALVQIPDSAYTVSSTDFVVALDTQPAFKAYCLRFAQAMFMSSTRLSACNSLHPINERCARWLLMAHDRVDGESISLTQEFLSQMLGVRRTSVTTAAFALQEAGFISCSRGQIIIRNRAGFESTACECYATLAQNWQKLMRYSIRKPSLVDTDDAGAIA